MMSKKCRCDMKAEDMIRDITHELRQHINWLDGIISNKDIDRLPDYIATRHDLQTMLDGLNKVQVVPGY